MKLDRIYTRGGDAGETSLGDGARVPKHHIRVRALGGLDSANAALGVAQSLPGATVQQTQDFADTGADLTVVLGSNYSG